MNPDIDDDAPPLGALNNHLRCCNGYHELIVNTTDYDEARMFGQLVGSNTTILRLRIIIQDNNTRRHCKYMCWLFIGLSRNRYIKEVSFVGIDFGRDSLFFSHQMRRLTTDRCVQLEKVSFVDCHFHVMSQFLALGQCFMLSRSIRHIQFYEIDFTSINGSRSVMMSYLNASFCNAMIEGQKNIRFQNCTLQTQHLVELMRGISGPNHPRSLLIEYGEIPISSDVCRLLNRELTNHSEANGSVSLTAYESSLIPPISILSLKEASIGDEGVSRLLHGGAHSFALVRLNLSSCDITDTGCYVISSMINDTRAPFLKILLLRNNRINDEGAISIANSLSRNTSIKTLCLAPSNYGHMTDITWLAFQRLVCDERSPMTIETSNHVLTQVTLQCQANVPDSIRGKLKRTLDINSGSRFTNKQETPIREKLIEFVHSMLLRYGANEFIINLFPAITELDICHQKQFVILFLGWVNSVYRSTYDTNLWQERTLIQSEYWANRIYSTIELSLTYSSIRYFCMSTELEPRASYPYKYKLRSSMKLSVQLTNSDQPHESVVFHHRLIQKLIHGRM